MQNYYGLAIRSNVGNLYAMKKVSNTFSLYRFCPRGKNSWCKYWALDIKDYKPKSVIPVWIKNLILPIITDLQADELLSKCLHGSTQNPNESLNAIVWSRVPKRTFVGKQTLEMGTYSAVLSYNEGSKGILEVLKQFNLVGFKTVTSAAAQDKNRSAQMKRKSSEQGKKQRKRLRTLKKGYGDEMKEKEQKDSYIPGGY